MSFLSINLVLILSVYLFNSFDVTTPSPFPSYRFNEDNLNIKKQKIEINCCNVYQIFILGFGVITLFWLSYLELCNHVRYVNFHTNLSICNGRKRSVRSPHCISTCLSFIILGLLLSEYLE